MIGIFGHSALWQQTRERDRIEAYLVLAGLYVMLAIPLLMAYKRWMADVSCGLLGVLLLISSIRKHHWQWVKEPPVIIALTIWLYSVLVVSPLAIDAMQSFTRAGWIRFILMFAAIVYWLSSYREEIHAIAKMVLAFLIYIAADAMLQYITGTSLEGTPIQGNRLTGPFDKVIVGIYLAKMSLPCIGILLYYAWIRRNRRHIAFLTLVLTGIFSVIVLSNERTATLTFIAAMGVVGIGLFIKLKEVRLLVCIVAALQISVLAGIHLSQETTQQRREESTQMLKNFGDSPYMQLWKASLYMWQEDPLFGTGMKNFRIACPKYIEEGRIHYCDMHSHNVYLEFLSEMGIFGFFGLILLIVSFVIMIIEQRAPSNRDGFIITLCAASTIMIHFFPFAANQSMFANWPGILAWQSIAWALAVARSEGKFGHG